MRGREVVKFKDIPQFTYGSYEFDIPLSHVKRKIEEWIEEDNLQLNPDFQRGHVWTEEQRRICLCRWIAAINGMFEIFK